MRKMPTFLENEEWYTTIENDDGTVDYELTPKASDEAVKSFNDFYSTPTFVDEYGNEIKPPDGWACD